MPRRKTTKKPVDTKPETRKKVVPKKTKGLVVEATQEASERVVRLTETEALRFGKMDAEMRNSLQGVKLKDFELDQYRREYLGNKQVLEQQKQTLLAQVHTLKPMYDDFIQTIAKKYGIKDPSQMSIDPDNGTVRDLSKH